MEGTRVCCTEARCRKRRQECLGQFSWNLLLTLQLDLTLHSLMKKTHLNSTPRNTVTMFTASSTKFPFDFYSSFFFFFFFFKSSLFQFIDLVVILKRVLQGWLLIIYVKSLFQYIEYDILTSCRFLPCIRERE